ncbi:MAG: S1 RNA-binding domain-containing protein [Planctomycetota bacterium]
MAETSEAAPAEPSAETAAATPEAPVVETAEPSAAADASPATAEESVAPAAVSSAKEALLKSAKPAEKEAAPAPTAEVAAAGDLPPEEQLDEALTAQLDAAMSADAAAPTAPAGGDGDATTPPATAVPAAAAAALEIGKRFKVTIASIGDEDVFVEIAGVRNPGVIPRKQFTSGRIPDVGFGLEAVVDKIGEDDETVTLSLPRAKRKLGGNWESVSAGQVVDARVSKSNKGGLEVQISGLRGFLPASQVDVGFVDDLEKYVGQTLTVKILEVNQEKRNLIVSRRAHLADERAEKAKEIWNDLSVGQTLDGTVKTIKDYGAFIDLGGVDGFLHVGEISWNRIGSPGEILSVGQQVAVKILKIDVEAKKIGLGMKQLISNPWDDIEGRYPLGSTASGRVTRTTDFGAFVELEQGVEGLVHISELDYRRVGSVTEVVSEGEQVDVKVLQVEPNRKRIALSIKQLKEKPQSAKPAAAEEFVPEPEPYKRKRKGQLRGGRSQDQGGGMFGNPDDYR